MPNEATQQQPARSTALTEMDLALNRFAATMSRLAQHLADKADAEGVMLMLAANVYLRAAMAAARSAPEAAMVDALMRPTGPPQ